MAPALVLAVWKDDKSPTLEVLAEIRMVRIESDTKIRGNLSEEDGLISPSPKTPFAWKSARECLTAYLPS